MAPKAPVVLVVLVETGRLGWLAAGLRPDGELLPLLRSEAGDLDRYRELTFDEQVGFLRHRLCGVLQRACDRLWARECKACQFVILFEEPLADSTGTLTQAVAEHFSQWLLNPPVAVFTGPDGFGPGAAPKLARLAGELDPAREELLHAHLGGLLAAREDPGLWELARKKVG